MRRSIFVGVFASVISLVGCAAGLTRAGSMMREATDLSVRTGCEFLGTIDESEKSGWDHADDRRGAMNRVRNRVAALGGDTFLVVSLESDAFGAYVQAEAYRCGTVGSAHQAPAPPAPRGGAGSTTAGSGFYVSRSGHVLTNAHAVEQCREVRIPPSGIAAIVARDDASDLALLKNDMATQPIPAFFRGGRGVQPGAAIVAIGFPLQGFIASGPSVTTGIISSLAGPSNDRRLCQMTAPIHPGSSGGPVLDDAGNVVGVATAKLDPFVVARETGDIPQNINFAVSAGIARAFLDAEGVRYEVLPSDTTLRDRGHRNQSAAVYTENRMPELTLEAAPELTPVDGFRRAGDSRQTTRFARYGWTMESGVIQRRETQIVQSLLNLRDFLP